MDRKKWLEERRTGIGGSDAGAVAGLSPWSTPLEVYYDKIGEGENIETPQMRRGTLLEPVVRQMYCDATGYTVVVPDGMIRHPVHDFAVVNLDGLVIDLNLVWEGKTARDRRGWGEPGSDEVPVVYLAQVQHGMMVAQMPRADIAVLFGDFELAIYHIEADPEFQYLLLEHEAAFWLRVQNRQPPDPITAADVQRRWPISQPIGKPASAEYVDMVAKLSLIKDFIKKLETVKEMTEAEIKREMEGVEALTLGNEQIVTWKTAKGAQRFDTKRFEQDEPTLYKKYLNQSATNRRFLIKGEKPCIQIVKSHLQTLRQNLLEGLGAKQD